MKNRLTPGHGSAFGDMPFVDEATAEVLGIRQYLGRLEADSARGRALAARPTLYRAGERAAWQREIRALEEATRFAADAPEAHRQLRLSLAQLPTLERPLRRLAAGESLRDDEFFEIKRFLFYGATIVREARALLAQWMPDVGEAEARMSALMAALHPEVRPTSRFHLSSDLDDTLAALRADYRKLNRRVRDAEHALEADIITRHGGSFDIEGRYMPPEGVDPGTIEALRAHHGAFYVRSPELTALRAELERLRNDVESAEDAVRAHLSDRLRPEVPWLGATLDALTALDLRLARVRLLHAIDGCWPQWRDEPLLGIEAGRHPQLVQQLAPLGEAVQPVDFTLDARPVVIVGPNMGGKSVLLELVGLCQWCAQHALPVPARRFEFAPVEAIVYVGSEEPRASSATEGLSSFGREVQRIVDWLGDANSESGQEPAGPRLWLLDEPARGTHPDEGAGIARALVDTLHARGHRVVATTHFPALAAHPAARKLRIAGLEAGPRFEALLARARGDEERIRSALRELMDYRPIESDEAEVPRDAWRIARALGLRIE